MGAAARASNSVHERISFFGRRVPVHLNGRSPNAGLMRNLRKAAVQRELLGATFRTIGEKIDPSAIASISVVPRLSGGIRFENGNLIISMPKARECQVIAGWKKKYRIILVLGGGTDRGIAHIGPLLGFEQLGIEPEMIVTTSAGAIIGALYALHKSAQKVERIIYEIVKGKSLQDFADPDLTGLRDRSVYSGIMKGKKLVDLFEQYGGLHGVKFTDPSIPQEDRLIPLYICAVNGNDGKLTVFGDMSKLGKADINTYKGPMTVMDAVRASFSIPAAFVPYSKDYNGEAYDFIDGGVRENLPFLTAAKILKAMGNRGRRKTIILAIHLGYCGELEGKLRNRNFAEIASIGLDFAFHSQLSAIRDELLAKMEKAKKSRTAVIVLNLGISNVKTPDAIRLTQNLVISGKHTLLKFAGILSAGRQFSPAHLIAPITGRIRSALEKNGFMVDRKGERRSIIRHKRPLIKRKLGDPVWKKYYREDGGKLIVKRPDKSMIAWVLGIVYKTWGLFKTLKLILHGLEFKYGGYINQKSKEN